MREAFKHFSAVAADIVGYAVADGLFAGREYGYVKAVSLFDRIETVIPVAVVNVSVDRAMYPCLAVFGKQKGFIESKIKSLNVVQRFLKRQRSDVLTLAQQILKDSIYFAARG